MSATKSQNGHTERDMQDILMEFGGNRLQIPEGMDLEDVLKVVKKRKEQDETYVTVTETVRAFPLDGAVAFAKVLKSRYGWADMVPSESFWGQSPPRMVGVEVGYEKTVQVPWGRCEVPKIEGILSTSFSMSQDGLPVFSIYSEVKRKYEKQINEIAEEVRQVVRRESIYKGKAIKVSFRDGDGDRRSDFGPSFSPQFINLDSINAEEIVYSEYTENLLNVNLFTVVEHTEQCRKSAVPLKRGILLQGPFGTGKTLTADLLALKCVKHGWTFLYLEDVRDLDLALGFAEMYSPCVVFGEDVDKAVAGERTTEMNRLFNTLDGFESKGREVIVVLTTNNPHLIHRGFLRPGRIDTVVDVTVPDEKAILKLVRLYGRDSSGNEIIDATNGDLTESMKAIEGVNAAFIREAVERAKLAAIHRGCSRINAQDLHVAVDSMRSHVEMLFPGLNFKNCAEETETIDPLRIAIEFVMENFAHSFVSQLANPKVLSKIVMKTMKRRPPGFGAPPGVN